MLAEISGASGHLRAVRDNIPQVVFPFFNLQGGTLEMKVSEQNEIKSFGEKLIEVANLSYLSSCKLNSVDLDV